MANETGSRNDPWGYMNFLVEIKGCAVAAFHQCSGLKIETEVLEYQEGGENSTVHRLVGQSKYSNIVLKRGFTDNKDLWEWYQRICMAEGPIEKREGSIVVLGDDGTEKSRWNFYDAWPCKWEGPEFDSKSQAGVAIEGLEIAVSRIQRMA